MAENDDEEGFGDFKFISSSSSSRSANGPDFSAPPKTTAVAAAAAFDDDDDDDDWGDFINSNNGLPRMESLPANHFHFDPFPGSHPPAQPDSAPSRVESAESQWAKLSGALPLSLFGEEEEEEESSVNVDAGFNGAAGAFPFPKKDENLKGKGSDLNDLLADLYKQNEKGNGFGSSLNVKTEVNLNQNVENWSWNGLNNLGVNGSSLKLDGLGLSGKASSLDKKEENFSSSGVGMERKEGNFGLNGLDLGSNGPSPGQNGSNLDSNGWNSDLVIVAEEEEDDGWEFRGAESQAEAGAGSLKSDQNEPLSNFTVSTLSWDPLGTISSGLNSNVIEVNSNLSKLNSSLVEENEEFGDDDGWEFKTAESQTYSGANGSAQVEGREQESFKGVEFGFGFANGMNAPSGFFGTSGSGGVSTKPGERDLGSSISPSFGAQNNQDDNKSGVIASPVDKSTDSDEMSWAFKDTISGNGLKPEEKPKVADASGVENFSFDTDTLSNREQVEKHRGALPLSIFGDVESETDDSLRCEDVFIHKPTSQAVVKKDAHSNTSINDLISSLYSQAEKNASLNHINNPSASVLLSSQTVVGSQVNGDDDFDDGSWEFKGAISGNGGEVQKSRNGFEDSCGKDSTEMGLIVYVDFYSKLAAELCFVALIHLDNMKKDRSIAAPSGQDAEVEAIEKEIQGLFNELQNDGTISKDMASENLQSRSIYLSEFSKVLEEKRFQVLESEYHLTEKFSLAEKDLKAATELLKHAASMLKILKLGSFEDQSNHVSTWTRVLSACALELKHGASLVKQSLQNNYQSQMLSKPQGRQYILALGEIYRVVKIVESSSKLYKPWIIFSSEHCSNFLALVRECSTLWSSSGLEEALQSLSDPADVKYEIEALLRSIQSIHDLDEHELYEQVFSGQEPKCCISGLSAGTVPGMRMVLWDGQHYFLTVANLWANLVSRDPPNLPHTSASE